MKKSKIASLFAVSVLSVGLLAACGSNNSSSSDSSSSEAKSSETSTSESKTDAFTGATAGTTDFDTLQKGFAANGAWLNATSGDIDASGKTLTIDGTFKNEKGEEERTLAMIAQNDKRQITKVYTLTVDRVIVNSPAFDLEGGNIKGDVYVGEGSSIKSRDMKGTDGKSIASEIEGNLYFATQEQLDTYNALPAAEHFKVSGEVAVKTA